MVCVTRLVRHTRRLEPAGIEAEQRRYAVGKYKMAEYLSGHRDQCDRRRAVSESAAFIRDLETNRQFIIINSVELERSTETNSAPPIEGEVAAGAGTPRGTLVSLRLEMSTYFQRGSLDNGASQLSRALVLLCR